MRDPSDAPCMSNIPNRAVIPGRLEAANPESITTIASMDLGLALRNDEGLLQHLEQAGRAHAAADAHRDHGIFRLAATALDQRVAGEACARHAVGMADRDRAAIDVDLFRIDAELVAAVQHLHGEGLVQFPE